MFSAIKKAFQPIELYVNTNSHEDFKVGDIVPLVVPTGHVSVMVRHSNPDFVVVSYRDEVLAPIMKAEDGQFRTAEGYTLALFK